MPPLNPNRAVGYVRGSTAEQQDTLTAQSDHIASYCTYRQLDLAHAPFVDSGTSAFSVPFYEREVAACMVQWMVENGVGSLILTKLDRGFRNTIDCLFTLRDLAAKGITVHILDIQLDTSTPVGKFVLTIMAAMAEMENERRAERQRDVFKVRKTEGKICGNIPYGMKLDDDGETLIEDDYEQRILTRLLPGGNLSHLSDNQAARELNACGIPTKRNGQWHGNTVRRIREAAKAHVTVTQPTPTAMRCGMCEHRFADLTLTRCPECDSDEIEPIVASIDTALAALA